MLIQITNRCHEGCAHCMQDSSPDGQHMDENTFARAVEFGLFLKNKVFVISGGEPTEHPEFLKFCKGLDKILSKAGGVFTVCSNGTWFPEKKEMIEKLSRLKTFSGMQVYTNSKWYKDYDFIMSHKAEIESIPNVSVSTERIYMQDLGRARNSPEAQAEVIVNPYNMSCLNGHLMFKQLNPRDRMNNTVQMNMMCKPTVDYKGDVHLSESCLCPAFGNVKDSYYIDLFMDLQDAKPCMGCRLAKRFLSSDNPKYSQVKQILQI